MQWNTSLDTGHTIQHWHIDFGNNLRNGSDQNNISVGIVPVSDTSMCWTRLRSEVSVLPRLHVALRQKTQILLVHHNLKSKLKRENQYFISQHELSLSYHKMLYILFLQYFCVCIGVKVQKKGKLHSTTKKCLWSVWLIEYTRRQGYSF